jgi:hypothetical protein
MTLLATSSSSAAFATPHAGEDYFATEGHYLSLAGRVVAALRHGSTFVFLTGDPPPDPLLFSRALEIAAAWWYAVIVIARDPKISRERLVRDPPRLAIPDDSHWELQTTESAPPLSPLFVFDAVDGLSGEQVENVYQSLLHREGMRSAGVLLTRTGFLARLEQSNPRLIEHGRIARFRLQELGRDEIETFIRRQQYPGDEPNAFTVEAVTAIADISRGDPALVNHLARLTLEFAALALTKEAEQQIAADAAVEAAVVNTVEPWAHTEATAGRRPSSPIYRRRSARWVQIGLLLVLATAGVLAVPNDGFLSIAERVAKSVPITRLPDFASWINPGRDQASAVGADNASEPVANTALPIAVVQATAQQTELVSIAAIPGHPTSEPEKESSTSEAADPRSASPNNRAQPIPNPASAAISGPSAGTPSAVLSSTTGQPHPSLQPAAAQSYLSSEDTAALVGRGDAFIMAGDISSARLHYERAAEAGDGRAALRMGATFDPAFLDQAGIRGAFVDPRQALTWYRRARDLGQAEAERRLNDPKPQ